MIPRHLNPSARAELTRPRCALCPHHIGLTGPDDAIAVCAVAENGRVRLATGDCPQGHFFAANLTQMPVVSELPIAAESGSHKDRIARLRGLGVGRIAVIVANGPSHAQAPLEQLLLPHVDFIQVNRPDPRIYPPRFWALCDKSQVREHAELIRAYTGTILTFKGSKCLHPNAIIFQGAKKTSLDLLAGANVGGTTTHAALQYAAWMRYDHIYLFGLDMSRDRDGKLYAWGSNPHLSDLKREGKFVRENSTLTCCGQIMETAGLKPRERITVCSSYAIERKWEFLNCFEAIPHETAVQTILERHPPRKPKAVGGAEPLTLLTCTGSRPEAFALCEKWMKRAIQVHGGPVQWIVVDDGPEPTACTLDQTVIRPQPFWDPNGPNTHARNLLAGLDLVKHDKLLIIEDDDHYDPVYLTVMNELLDRFDLVGEGMARYYNVAHRGYVRLPNRHWASACMTGLRAPIIDALKDSLDVYAGFDMNLWRDAPEERKHLFFGRHLVTGIKGMPGRPGSAWGHRMERKYLPDPDLKTLRRWIGADADDYQRFYRS